VNRLTDYLLLLAVSYLIGSIPFSLIFSKILKGVDVRKEGSGNVGAANALALSGKRAAALAATCDIAKGFAAVTLARIFIGSDLSAVLAALTAILGHDFPVYLGFSGGKGISTTAGAIIAFNPYAMAIVMAAYFTSAAVTRYLILSSLISLAVVPIIFLALHEGMTVAMFGPLALLLALYAHREDIKRLMSGKETKLGEAFSRVL
jgi:acyl phosphate:glycerol-3-phosphate acyltransferase